MEELLPGLAEALEAMNRGDVEPAVALLDPDVDWRARSSGHLWWRFTPSCHGHEEARENFRRQVTKGLGQPGVKRFSIDQLDQVGDRIVVGGSWQQDQGGGTGEFFQVLTVRDGLVVDIQGCSSLRAAVKYARTARPG